MASSYKNKAVASSLDLSSTGVTDQSTDQSGVNFTTAEVAQATGCSIRQLDYWDIQGLTVPSVRAASGSGTRRLYSLSDLVQIRFILRLKRSGWSLRKIRQAVHVLKEVHSDADPLKHSILIHEQGTLLVVLKTKSGTGYLMDALKAGGQIVMEIVLETLFQETVATLRQQK